MLSAAHFMLSELNRKADVTPERVAELKHMRGSSLCPSVALATLNAAATGIRAPLLARIDRGGIR